MDGVIDIEDARALTGDGRLWPLARDFLWNFATQVHPSWLDGLGGLASPRMRAYALSRLGVEPCFHKFPSDDCSRIILLDAATMDAIAKWLGALACSDSLRRIMDGATVRGLKAALPGVYPDVFGYTMYFTQFLAKHSAQAKCADDVLAAGPRILLSLFAHLPGKLVSRVQFKFPKDSPFAAAEADFASGGSGTAEDGYTELKAAVLKLLKLKFPEAYLLCCS